MYCPYCKKHIEDIVNFCPSCGINIKEVRKIIIQQSNLQEQSIANNILQTNNFNMHNNEIKNKKMNKNKRYLIIILLMLGIIFLGLCLFFLFRKSEDEFENIPEQDINEEEKVTYNTLQKLKNDYEKGTIDINEYFTELVYYEFDSSKLNTKYKSDELYYSTGCQSELLELLEKHKDELNQDIIKIYIENVTLHNVSLGDDTSVEQQFNSLENYEVELLDNKDEGNAVNHRLDKVTLSRNGNFLIWYTNFGNDAITEEQLEQISNGLESSISEFEDKFGVQYSYFSYKDAIFNNDYKNAKEVLKKNGIPIGKLDSAMSVYIYDTGSDNVLATYTNPYGAYLILDFVVQLGLNDGDGVVSFPYIVINKRGISNENESLKQLYNHELFHHFQYLFCRSTSLERCIAKDYAEGMANFASAITSNVSTTNNFLNDWAGIYTKNVSTKLAEITDGLSYGYGTFPYFYAYSKVVNDWSIILMNAHNETDPFGYIKNNTSKDDLVKVSDILTYGLLTKSFDNKAMYSYKDVTIKDVINSSKSLNETINAGAIVYYEVSGDNSLKITSNNKEYVGLKFYGYKDGAYKELASSMDKIEVDLSYYVRYDKFYVAIYNADITNSNSYSIVMKGSNFAENSNFVTTFNNYNIEIKMDLTIAGVTTNMVSIGKVDEQHQKEYLDVTTTSMGLVSLNNKVYHDFNSGWTYMTQPYGGDVWWKEKSASQMVDLGVILNKLISMKNVTKLSDNHYKVKMDKNDIKGLLSFGNADVSTLSGDVYVDVYTENGYITKLEYDFSKMIKGFEKFTTTIKCSNYDNAGDVEIPQSIIDNAKSQ